MLGLGEQIVSGEFRIGRFIDDHHHFARPGDGVDIDFAINESFRQGDEEIARPDDFIDPRNAFHAVGQRRDGLRAAKAINLVDAQLVAGGQHVGVVRAELGGRGDHGQLLHAGHLGGHGRHQHGRRIRRRSARHANARPIQRPIPLPQISARPLDANIAMQNRRLKSPDILPHAANGFQKLRIGLRRGPARVRPAARGSSRP